MPELRVHEHSMKESGKEKYLGDVISSDGKINETIENRKSKGQGTIAEINAIIDTYPIFFGITA